VSKRYIIIGASAAGMSAAQKITLLEPEAELIVISAEKETPYNKCFLADYISGIKLLPQVYLPQVSVFEQGKAVFMREKRVVAIDVAAKKVTLDDQQELAYDALCIATGCSPRIPPITGMQESERVFTFYSLHDMNRLRAWIAEYNPKKAVVIGSGLSGVEAADALVYHGIQVTIIEQQKHVLPAHLDHEGAFFLEAQMRRCGLVLHCNTTVTLVQHTAQGELIVHLDTGMRIDADLIISAAGVRPNNILAQQGGIALMHERIVTDAYMRSSVADIYAAGDVALVPAYQSTQLSPSFTWPDAMLQGIIAAHAMVGNQKPYPGVMPIVSSAFFGLKFASCGPVNQTPEGYTIAVKQTEHSYQKILLEDSRVRGFLQIGPTLEFGALKRALLTGQSVAQEAVFLPLGKL
jgi:nitrite reductase (NADH) large subunit